MKIVSDHVSQWVCFGLLLLLSTAAQAQGSNGAGNGGNAVVCYSDANRTEISSIEMFDYWEMRQLHPEFQSLDLGAPGLSVASKIDLVMGRIQVLFPALASELRQKAKLIVDNIDYYLEADIPVVIDDNSPLSPKAPCYKEQFAVQYKTPSPGQKRFLVSRRLYLHPRATNDTRAGIILHEVLYRFAIERFQHSNSDSARWLNYAFASNPFERGSEEALIKALDASRLGLQGVLHAVRLPFFGNQLILLTHSPSDPDQGRFYPFRNFRYSHPLFQFNLSIGDRDQPSDVVHHRENRYRFFTSGMDISVSREGDFEIEDYAGVRVNVAQQVYVCEKLAVDRQGTVRHCALAKNKSVTIQTPVNTFVLSSVRSIAEVRFSQTGKVETVLSYQPLELVTAVGSKRMKLRGTMQFDSNGLVVGAALSGATLQELIPVPVSGKVIVTNSFSYNPVTGLASYGEFGIWVQESARNQGLRMIGNLKNSHISEICEKRGYMRNSYSLSVQQVQSVLGTEELFDYPQNRRVIKTDEPVSVLTELWCPIQPITQKI